MDVFEGLRRSFRALNLNQRVGVGAALVVAAVAVGWFANWVNTPSFSVLYSDLPESQVSQVTQSLDSAGIPYRLDAGGRTVLVPRESVYQVRADLAGEGIQGEVVPQGYELLDSQGLTVSDFRQRVDYQRALEGELSRTLAAMTDIGSATVHLVIPDEALFAEDQEPVTASVLLDPTGTLDEADIEAITLLVSSSVEGLEPSMVTVADTKGTVLHAGGEENVTSTGNRQMRMTQDFEDAMVKDISSMLATVLGSGRASVVVRAELDYDERSTESETYTPDSATPIRQQTIDETFTGAGSSPLGTVGVDGASLGTDSDTPVDYSRQEDTTEYGIDKLVVRSVEAPGTVERLSVAVVLDDGSLTGATAPDVKTVEALVAAAAGIQDDRGDSLEVSAAPFPKPDDIQADEEPEASGGIMDLVPTIVGSVLLLVVAAGLFLMTRSKGGKDDSSAPVAALGGATYYEPGFDPSQFQGMTSDVIQLVERQPEEIATLLRSWLADRRDMPVG